MSFQQSAGWSRRARLDARVLPTGNCGLTVACPGEELARVVGCACDSLDHCTCDAAYLARRGRESETPTPLHVTNGESAGNTLRQTGLGGAVMSWNDVLHEGPVQAVPRSKLLRERAAFLSDAGWGSRRAVLSSFERREEKFP